MLYNLHPNRKKSKFGGLTDYEKRIAKGMLEMGYLSQDITFIINQGRNTTINQGRIADSVKNNNSIKKANKKEINEYIEVQSSYNPKTMLNPHKHARIIKAREAMICAVSTYNNPSNIFRTELFCVLVNIAWTYLLHEKLEEIEKGSTTLSTGKSISVNAILKKTICPIKDEAVKENLRKIIEIRDTVEHTTYYDDGTCFGALFQACCINFDNYLTQWYGEKLTLTHDLSLALQFCKLDYKQILELESAKYPPQIKAIAQQINESSSYNNNSFEMKVYFTTEATSKTNSDIHKLITYSDTAEATVIAKQSFRPTLLNEKQVISIIKKEYPLFTKKTHQDFWKTKWKNAKERNQKAHQKYGEAFNGWAWYKEKWIPEVQEYCKDKYK